MAPLGGWFTDVDGVGVVGLRVTDQILGRGSVTRPASAALSKPRIAERTKVSVSIGHLR